MTAIKIFGVLIGFTIYVSCGGSQAKKPAPRAAASKSAASKVAAQPDNLDVERPKSRSKPKELTADRSIEEGDKSPDFQEPSATPAAPVLFIMKNTGAEDLVFNMDRGLQPVIFAFSGKPPKAKPIIMFAKFCTASCGAAEEDRCPHCPQPTKVADVRTAEKREIVAPGASFTVPWDARVFNYERTKGLHENQTKRCECFKIAPVPPDTYTVRACGLRVTTQAEKRSKYQCVDGSMTLPEDKPIEIEFLFPDPE